MLGHAVVRRLPAFRLWVRHRYWGLQRQRYDRIARQIDVDKSVFFFEAYGGRGYACSPRAIYEHMCSDDRFADATFVWSFKEGCAPKDEPLLDRAALVQRGSPDYYEALALSGTIVLNTRLPEYVWPKPGQTYVQCWHGTPLKRLGYDVQVETSNVMNTTSELAERFGMDAQKWTYLLSPSPYTSEHLCDAFGLPGERRAQTVLEVGYPRNDVLVANRSNVNLRDALREKLGVPEGKRALLYAPTWRDDQYTDGVGYSFDLMVDFDELRSALGSEWVVLFRPHYYIANSFDFGAQEGFVIDVSKVGDVNDLYLAADALLTDYSSTMFDFANLRRPLLLYCPDLQEYMTTTRGFYFDIHEVPGPLCSTMSDLLQALCNLGDYWETYGASYDSFVERFCSLEDGHAAERVVATLVERL